MSITKPDLIPQPFAAGGDKNTIPDTPISESSRYASWQSGFPAITRVPKASGGLPPSGLDMNGVINEISAHTFYKQSGGGFDFDQTFATANGGYPIGATLRRSDGKGYWLNTVANNATDPEDGGTGWIPSTGNGSVTIALSDSSATLTELQANSQIIILTGTLTANVDLIFPTWIIRWTVINQCTGAYTVTCKTAAGTGVVFNSNDITEIIGDGTNISKQTASYTEKGVQFGTCATAAATAKKAVTLADFELKIGAQIEVVFDYANTAEAPTLNVNNTGAKAVYTASGVASASNPCRFPPNCKIKFEYDGTNYVLFDTVVKRGALTNSWYEQYASGFIRGGGTFLANGGAVNFPQACTAKVYSLTHAYWNVPGGNAMSITVPTLTGFSPNYYTSYAYTIGYEYSGI